MDFWIAVVSGGAAVLGAAVGGVVAALPAWGAEKRAAETARRAEMRLALLAVIGVMSDTLRAQAKGERGEVRDLSMRFIQLNSNLGSLLKGGAASKLRLFRLSKDESTVTSYSSTVMFLIVDGYDKADELLSLACVEIPAWFRGSMSLAKLREKDLMTRELRDAWLAKAEATAKS